MPTNVTAEYLAAEEEYRNAKTIPEKIRALEKMYATVPKHKGTEKLRLQIKRKLAELRKELEKQRQMRKGGGGLNGSKEGRCSSDRPSRSPKRR